MGVCTVGKGIVAVRCGLGPPLLDPPALFLAALALLLVLTSLVGSVPHVAAGFLAMGSFADAWEARARGRKRLDFNFQTKE
jgi:hypothetical protein